ncbi:alpha/beta hydrolase [Noviherbaspirillum agri]
MNYSIEHDAVRNVAQKPALRRGKTGRSALLLAAGAALVASALAVRRKTQQAERDNPPLGEFIEIDGIRLHYVERGTGQPLVLFHGDGSMIQDYDTSGLIDLASKNHRVIVFDRPGYGYSERPRDTIWTPQAQARLLHRALLFLDVEQPIVVGHSWGTLVAVSMGLEFPDYVKSLVLLSGYYYPTPRADVPLLSPPAIPVIGDLMRYTISPLIGRAMWPAMLRRIFGPAPVPARFASGFPVWMALRPSQLRASAAEAALMIPAAFSLRKRYHELMMPVIIMSGDRDRYVDMHTQSEQLHHALPHSTLHVTHGAGHMLHHLAVEEVMQAIEQASQAAGAVQQAASRQHADAGPPMSGNTRTLPLRP